MYKGQVNIKVGANFLTLAGLIWIIHVAEVIILKYTCRPDQEVSELFFITKQFLWVLQAKLTDART